MGVHPILAILVVIGVPFMVILVAGETASRVSTGVFLLAVFGGVLLNQQGKKAGREEREEGADVPPLRAPSDL
jgi:hypothetical protein